MARVVQRKSSPPYLLIVFVMLFVAATALAVIFRNQLSKQTEARQTVSNSLKDARDELDNRDNKVIPGLVRAITGQAVNANVAEKAAQEAVLAPSAQAFANDGLANVVKGLDGKVSGLEQDKMRLQSLIDAEKAKLAAKDTSIKTMKAQADARQAALAKERDALQKQLTTAVAAKDKQMAQAIAEQRDLVAQRDKQVSLLAQQKNDVQQQITNRDGVIATLKAEIRRLKPTIDAGNPLGKIDGIVAKVLPEQGLCYISLGRKDGVRRGLPFAVYPARAVITEKDVVKAKIIVVSVYENTSECRIIESKREDPVVESDLIANLAFDTSRTYKFVVEGDFDLYASGRPDPLGNSRIAKMIQQWGAKVVDAVNVDTDFVIMGSEPILPPKPASDAPPQEWEIYRLELKKYKRYHQVREEARKWHVQILNTTRFLAYSGVVPKSGIVE